MAASLVPEQLHVVNNESPEGTFLIQTLIGWNRMYKLNWKAALYSFQPTRVIFLGETLSKQLNKKPGLDFNENMCVVLNPQVE